MTITFALSHQIIGRTDSNLLAAGSKNYVTAQFDLLTEDWTAPITVLFGDYAVVLDQNNQCPVPWEVLENPGQFQVSAFCGDLHTATSVPVVVHPSGYQEGQTPQPPTPSVYQQLTGMVQTAIDAANDVVRRADAGAFDGAQGPQGEPGPQGPQGEMGPQGPAGAEGDTIDDTQASLDHPWSGAKTEETIGAVSEQLEELSQTVDVILGKDTPSTFAEIRFAVEQGNAAQFFSVGDQLKPTWSDGVTSYPDPFNIVQLECAPELESGETVHGMMLQQHYATVQYCPFDAQEALYDAESELPAGTYHFTIAGNTWISGENGKVIQFTLTKPVPAGGQIVFADETAVNQLMAGQSVNTYASPTSTTPIETAVLSEGSSGVDLGTTDGTQALNTYRRAFQGSSRWKTSMIRQYLNSSQPAGKWWTKQDKWDRASEFTENTPGFMAGFDADFLAVLKPVKVQTMHTSGKIDVTYDYFFPISLEQLNAVAQTAGAEGDALDYWKAVAAADTTGNLSEDGRFQLMQTAKPYPGLVNYALNSHTTRKNILLRSVDKNEDNSLWRNSLVGVLNTVYPGMEEIYFTPACVIC